MVPVLHAGGRGRASRKRKLVNKILTLQLLCSAPKAKQAQRNAHARDRTRTQTRSTLPCGVRSGSHSDQCTAWVSSISFSTRTAVAHVACRLSALCRSAEPPRPRPRAGAEPSRERHVHGSRDLALTTLTCLRLPSQRYVSGASRPGVTHHSVRGRLLASVMGGGASSSKSSTHSSFSATRVVAGRGGGGAGAGAA